MKKIHLWSIAGSDPGSVRVRRVEEVRDVEVERKLEDLLVASPDLLLPNLTLVARQLPTDGGALDLLGVDEEGRLVLFELKRGTLTREAVAQALDYASDLVGRDADELLRLIEDHSGSAGIERIEDFADWHTREYPSGTDRLDDPPRIVLVGLGADERAKRMVNFLAEAGIDVQLLTFHGFSVDGRLFLARQVETDTPGPKRRSSGGTSKQENERQLYQLADKHRVRALLAEAADFVNARGPWYRWPGKTAYSFSLPGRTDEGRPTQRAYVTLYVNQKANGQVLLALQDTALRAAPEAAERFVRVIPGAFRDDAKWPPLQATFDRELWEGKVQSALERLLEALVEGWKSNQLESDEAPSEEEGAGL